MMVAIDASTIGFLRCSPEAWPTGTIRFALRPESSKQVRLPLVQG